MSKQRLAAGTSPFAHLVGRMLGQKPAGKQAEDGDIAPDDDGVVDQSEVDEVIDDENLDDAEDGAKKGKKKGKKAEADDDEPEAAAASSDDGDDDADKDAKAFHRGSTAQLKRCRAIFASPAAAGQPILAAQLAFETPSMSSAAAIAVMTTAAATASGSRGLDARMGNRDEPRPGADGGPGASGKPSLVDRLAAAKKAAGIA